MINNINLTNRVQACDNINKWDCFHKTIADGIGHGKEEICCSKQETMDDKRIEEPFEEKV